MNVKLLHSLWPCWDNLRSREYGDNVDEYIQDQVIDKCCSDQLRIKLLAEGKDLTLDTTLEVAQRLK